MCSKRMLFVLMPEDGLRRRFIQIGLRGPDLSVTVAHTLAVTLSV